MKIEYSDDFGSLKFICNKDEHELTGIVPDSVIDNGNAAIKKYVQKKMQKYIHQTRKDNVRNKKRAERIKNTNVLISLKHDGQNLRGRVVDYRGSADRGLITIILESPKKYKGADSIYSCYGMAMAGIRVFDEEGNLTRWARDESKESLIKIYEGAKKRELVKKLNNN